jgi:hypothetical protein
VNDQNSSYARLRHTAMGALAALAAVGAIAGAAALAANPPDKTHGHAAVAKGEATKAPTSPVPGKTHTSQPGSNQPFLTAVKRLVDDGTISTTEGQALGRAILAGRIDTQTLVSSGFTHTQLQAVEQTLANTKRALANASTRTAPDASAPASAVPDKRRTPKQDANNPFVIAVQRLVHDGTISEAEGQAVDREILAGSLDPQTLTSSGFTQSQLRAVEQTLYNTKRAL